MAPSAVVFDNRLHVFYGSDECPWSEENMWYRFVDQHGNWWPEDNDEEVVGSTTAVAPAVAVFRGRLYVVYVALAVLSSRRTAC